MPNFPNTMYLHFLRYITLSILNKLSGSPTEDDINPSLIRMKPFKCLSVTYIPLLIGLDLYEMIWTHKHEKCNPMLHLCTF